MYIGITWTKREGCMREHGGDLTRAGEAWKLEEVAACESPIRNPGRNWGLGDCVAVGGGDPIAMGSELRLIGGVDEGIKDCP